MMRRAAALTECACPSEVCYSLRFSQRCSLRFCSVKNSCPTQVIGVSSWGIGAMQMRVRPIQRCAKMLWPQLRHFGMRFIALLLVVARVTSPAPSRGHAHAVKVGARRAKPAHTRLWARRTLTVCDTANSGDSYDFVPVQIYQRGYAFAPQQISAGAGLDRGDLSSTSFWPVPVMGVANSAGRCSGGSGRYLSTTHHHACPQHGARRFDGASQ